MMYFERTIFMLNCLAVGAGGFIGAVLRYLLSMIPIRETGSFPINTLIINVLGAFAIGCIAAMAARHAQADPRLILFLKTGICGGFTTFSTFALETTDLMKAGLSGAALLYVLLSVVLCIAAVLLSQVILPTS